MSGKHFVELPDEAIDNEEWRQIPMYDAYEVSNYGRVRNAKNQRMLSQRLQASGFPIVNMLKDGKIHTRLVHTLVMRAFVAEPTDGYVVRHLDGQKVNNALTNLEYQPRKSVEPKPKKPRKPKKSAKVTDQEIETLEDVVSGVDNSEEL